MYGSTTTLINKAVLVMLSCSFSTYRRIGRLVKLLKDKNLYDNTLIVVVSDNGGPIANTAGASNFPLRGGKYGNFQGGVRANAFLSGGYIPVGRRGITKHGLTAMEDW
jgi:arylsulfatase B